eukprot:8354083-Pyramimonas_sp.AAC.1
MHYSLCPVAPEAIHALSLFPRGAAHCFIQWLFAENRTGSTYELSPNRSPRGPKRPKRVSYYSRGLRHSADPPNTFAEVNGARQLRARIAVG